MNDDNVKANITFLQMLKGLWPYAKRHPYLLIFSLISVLGVAISSRIMPFLIGYAIDHGFREKNIEALRWAAIGFLIAEVAHVVFLFAYQYLFQWFGNRMLYNVREDLVRHTQHLPMSYFNKTPVGRIVTRLTNDTATLGEVFTDGLINVFTETIVLLSIVVSMLVISWKLGLATLILTPLFFWLSFRITEKIRLILRDSKQKLSALSSLISENLSGIKVVQIFNRAPRNRAQFNRLSGDYKNLLLESIRFYAFLQPIMNLFNAVTITTALYYGGLLAEGGALQIGALVAFLMHVQDFVHPLREILEKYQQFQNSLTSAERVFHLLEEPTEESLGHDKTLSQPPERLSQIEFKNLNFKYEDQLPLVLKNISLKIGQGQSVAFVGRTGSGKTTLISLLQRFYEAPPHSIYIDGLPIESLPRQLLRSRIGVVQQDNFIFHGTVRENISLGDPQISEAKINAALDRVGYSKLLRRSGRHLNSMVEEKGANLSVGERQLLAFARILAFEPQILILDEATSNIDSETESLIQQATKEITAGRTSLIIAHRLSTIQNCDQIAVLSDGEIREIGSHQDLLAKKGLYAQLAEAGVNETLIVE